MSLKSKIGVARNRYSARIRKWLPVSLGGRLRQWHLENRLLQPDDAPALWQLMGEGPSKVTVDDFRIQLASDDRFCLGAWHQEALIAAIWVSPQWRALGIGGHWIGGALVRRDMRGRGVAQFGFAKTPHIAIERGMTPLFTNVNHDNESSIAATLSIGMQPYDAPDWQEILTRHLTKRQLLFKFPNK